MEKIRWQKMIDDTKNFFTAPTELYSNFEKEGGYLELIFYFTLMTIIGELILILFFTILHPKYLAINMILCILFIPISLVGFFISTIILHIIWTMLGSQESFETSLRCNASLSPLFPVGILASLIPFFGKWIGMFIYLFIVWFYLVLASNLVHKIETDIAKKVFLIIFIIIAFIRMTYIVKWEIKKRNQRKKIKEMVEEYEKRMKKYEEDMMKMYEQQKKIYEESQKNSQ